MANSEEQKVFSIGDRVCYNGRGEKRYGTISDRQTVYSWGVYRYQIIFDGNTKSDGLWYEEKDISEIKQEQNNNSTTESKPLYCRQCGTLLAQNAVFCRKCGTKVENFVPVPKSCGKSLNIIDNDTLNNIAEEIAILRSYESFLDEIKGDFSSIEDLMEDTRTRLLMGKEGLSYNDALKRIKKKYPPDSVQIDFNDSILIKLQKASSGQFPTKTAPENDTTGSRSPDLSEIKTFDDFMSKYSI